jgi:beta-galactosidase
MNPDRKCIMKIVHVLACLVLFFISLPSARADDATGRHTELLNGAGWEFVGAGADAQLPKIGTDEFNQASWQKISVPHNFQTRNAYDTLTQGWYRRQVTVDPSTQGKELYLVFEGAASIADVYVNGQHLGQHRGAYTRFIFDATKALHPGSDNQLAVLVDDTPANTLDCLPISRTGLYKVWGGLYRNVWLMTTSRVHIDPTDFAAQGVYLTPKIASAESASLNIRVLLRNASADSASAQVQARIIDPDGKVISSPTATEKIAADGRSKVEFTVPIDHPQLWGALSPHLYRVETTVSVKGQPVDEVTQSTGFRWLNWDWKGGNVSLNGKRIIFYGADLHQEVEEKGSAVSPDDLKKNFDDMKDLGINFIRLPHYPHAQLEYDLCDQQGILCWAEAGHSNSKDIVGPTAAQIATEMVKQNYNHPSIAVWSMGNESNAAVADQIIPIAKALDPTRPVGVAAQKSELADFHSRHVYFGWYGPRMADFKPEGFIDEVGGGGVVTTHVDYDKADWKVNKWEPEEYQQILSDHNFQQVFHGENSHLGMFLIWCLREFSDGKYKGPIGINSKGLITYAGDKKDIYYLYRSFLRSDAPTVWITSKRYFLRRGAVNNGIKVYSNAAHVTLTLNGEKVSTLANGQYVLPDGPWVNHNDKPKKGAKPGAKPKTQVYVPEKIDNVFYWPVPLHTGKNVVSASDDQGNTDTATIYFYGDKGLPELHDSQPSISHLTSSNTDNPVHYMDMPVQAQWPIYYDLDSTADNSTNLIPDAVKGSGWLALQRVTKEGHATDVSFTVTKPTTVWVMVTKQDAAPAWLTGAGFTQVKTESLDWRGNDLILVPAELYSHHFSAGESVKLALGERDALIMVKTD